MPETKITETQLCNCPQCRCEHRNSELERYFDTIEDALAGVRGMKQGVRMHKDALTMVYPPLGGEQPHEFREEMRADAEGAPPSKLRRWAVEFECPDLPTAANLDIECGSDSKWLFSVSFIAIRELKPITRAQIKKALTASPILCSPAAFEERLRELGIAVSE